MEHFGAREYDPRLGRWTAKDPALWGGGATGLYEYAAGAPTCLIDPTGKNSAAIGGAIAVVVVVGVGILAYMHVDVSHGADAAAKAEAVHLPGPGGMNGPEDAVRHCIATCIATANYGETIEEAMEWWHPEDDSTRDGHMDNMNNGEGRTCGAVVKGKGGDTTKECTKACMDSYRAGRLDIMPKSTWK